MVNTAGFRTLATESWIAPLLVGSNNVLEVRVIEFAEAGWRLLVATDADLVVIKPADRTRQGYCTLASGFTSVDALPTGEIFAAGAAAEKQRVYQIDLADVSGDSSSHLQEFLSTTVGPGSSVRLRSDTAFAVRARQVPATPPLKMLYVLEAGDTGHQPTLDVVNLNAPSLRRTRGGGSGFAKGDLLPNLVAWRCERFVHAFDISSTQTSLTNEDVLPTFSLGRVFDDFHDNADNPEIWLNTLSTNGAGEVAEQNHRREFSLSSADGAEAALASNLLATLCGGVGVEVDWTVTQWPTLTADKRAMASLVMTTPGDSLMCRISRVAEFTELSTEPKDSLLAEVYVNAALVVSQTVDYAGDSGRLRIIKTATPFSFFAYQVQLQYWSDGSWQDLLTHATDDAIGLAPSIGVASNCLAAQTPLGAYFEDFAASADDSPEIYTKLPAHGVVAAAVGRTLLGEFFCAAAYADPNPDPDTRLADHARVFALPLAAGNPYRIGETQVGDPIVDVLDGTWALSGAAHAVLPSPVVRSVAFNDSGLMLLVGTDVGVQQVPVALVRPGASASTTSPLPQKDYFQSTRPSQRLVADDIHALDCGNGAFVYGTADGAGWALPDQLAPITPRNGAVALDDLSQTWTATWLNPAAADFLGVSLGRRPENSDPAATPLLWLLNGGQSGGDASWTDDFPGPDINPDNWWVPSPGYSIVAGRLRAQDLQGQGAHVSMASKHLASGDAVVTVDFADLDWQCADEGDQVWAGVLLGRPGQPGDPDVNLVWAYRQKRYGSPADVYGCIAIVGGVFLGSSVLPTTAAERSGKLRIERQGSRVHVSVFSNDAWHDFPEYDGFPTASTELFLNLEAIDPNAPSTIYFDHFAVQAQGGGGSLIEDPWSDDFAGPAIDAERWQTMGTGCSIDGGRLKISCPVGQSGNLGLMGRTELAGDFDILVDFADLDWQCADPGDNVWSGLLAGQPGSMGDPTVNFAILRRAKAYSSPTDVFESMIVVAGVLVAENRIETTAAERAGRLRIQRVGNRLRMAAFTGGRWQSFPDCVGFATKSLPLLFLLEAEDANAQSDIYYDDLMVQAQTGSLAWLPEDPWSDDFQASAIDPEKWQLPAPGMSIVAGRLRASDPAGQGDHIALTGKYKVKGDFVVAVDYADIDWQCADENDQVQSGLIFGTPGAPGDPSVSLAFVYRLKRYASPTDVHGFAVMVGGAIVASAEIETSAAERAGRLRLERRHNRLRAAVFADGRWRRFEDYVGFPTASMPLVFNFQAVDPNAGANIYFSGFAVQARPDFRFIAAGGFSGLPSGFDFALRAADEAGNLGAVVDAEVIQPGTDETDPGDPWADHFIIADTLVDPGLSVLSPRPSEAGVRLGPPIPAEDNQGRSTLLAMETPFEYPGSPHEFSATFQAISGARNCQYAMRLLSDADTFGDGGPVAGWMAPGTPAAFADPRHLDTGLTIADLCSAETDEGDLLIVYRKPTGLYMIVLDRVTGAPSGPTFVNNGTNPAMCRHRDTGNVVLVCTFPDEKAAHSFIYNDGAWVDQGAFYETDAPVTRMRLASLRTFTGERLVLLLQCFRLLTYPHSIWASDDGGRSWYQLLAHDSFLAGEGPEYWNNAASNLGHTSLAAGASGSGEMLVAVVNKPDTGEDNRLKQFFAVSPDGANWTYIGDLDTGLFFSLAALPQRVFSGGPEGLGEMYTNWVGVHQKWTADDDPIEPLNVTMYAFQDRSPRYWGPDCDFGHTPHMSVLDANIQGALAPLRPWTHDLHLAVWRGRPALLVNLARGAADQSLHVLECQKWQRPPDRMPYQLTWFPACDKPDQFAGWTLDEETGPGGYGGADLSPDSLVVRTSAKKYVYASPDVSAVSERKLASGLKVRFRLQARAAADPGADFKQPGSYHGLRVRLNDGNDTVLRRRRCVEVSLYCVGPRAFRLYDEVAQSPIGGGLLTVPDLGGGETDGVEGILALGTDDDGSDYVQVWLRVDFGLRQLAFFAPPQIPQGDGEPPQNYARAALTPHYGEASPTPTANHVSFGAFTTSSVYGETAWSSVQIGESDRMHQAADLPADLHRARRAGGYVQPFAGGLDFVCGAQLAPSGGLPAANDRWRVAPQAEFATDNAFRPDLLYWRTADDRSGAIALFASDPAAGGRGFTPGGVGLFGANVPRAFVQFGNDAADWSAAPVTVRLDAWRSKGVLGATTGARASVALGSWTRRWRPGTGKTSRDGDWQTALQDHELAGLYLKMTGGAAVGRTFLILDNVAGFVSFAGDAPWLGDNPAAAGDGFIVFGGNLVGLPPQSQEAVSAATYKYMRVWIPRVTTYEGYYRLGAVAAGPLHRIETDSTCRTWADLSRRLRFPREMARSLDGTLLPRDLGPERAEITLRWDGLSPSQMLGIEAFCRRLGGPDVPVVYLPVARRNSTTSGRNNYEAMLARVALEQSELKPTTAAEIWESAALTLEEIPVVRPSAAVRASDE